MYQMWGWIYPKSPIFLGGGCRKRDHAVLPFSLIAHEHQELQSPPLPEAYYISLKCLPSGNRSHDVSAANEQAGSFVPSCWNSLLCDKHSTIVELYPGRHVWNQNKVQEGRRERLGMAKNP